MAEAESIARRLGDPATLSQALQLRADEEAIRGHLDICQAFADEALRWATLAGDKWQIANASYAKAVAASDAAELRERVDRAAALADEVGNLHLLARLLYGAAYAALCMRSARDARRFAERALPIARTLDDPFTWMLLQGNFGLAALLTGDADVARDAFRTELELCRELVVPPIAAEGLVGLAAVAVIRGNLRRAAQLLGAAEAHQYGIQQDDVAEDLHDAFFRDARVRYGSDRWQRTVQEGAALSFDSAIAYALDEPPAHVASR
jgi:hypothetical protein